jgi:glutaredoxin
MRRPRPIPILLLASALVWGPATAGEAQPPAAEACRRIELYTATGCPHCARALRHLEDLQQRRPDLDVTRRSVTDDPAARRRLFELSERHGVDPPGVPAFLICDRFLVGFDEAATTGADIERLLAAEVVDAPGAGRYTLALPLLGAVSLDQIGLPLFTVAIGLMDGFNPCAMWVLLFLLSVLVNLRDRARMLLIAGTFVIVSGAVYFAFMAAWLNLFLIVGFSRALQIAVGATAALVGAVHVKDFFALGRGVSLSIPQSAKPGLYARLRRVMQADNLGGAMAGILIIAVLVNFLELLCTAGLPALYTQILTMRDLAGAEYYGYLLLYNVAYVFDDALMVGLVTWTLGRRKLDARQGRWLKLASGLVILVLGLLLLLAPQWLL